MNLPQPGQVYEYPTGKGYSRVLVHHVVTSVTGVQSVVYEYIAAPESSQYLIGCVYTDELEGNFNKFWKLVVPDDIKYRYIVTNSGSVSILFSTLAQAKQGYKQSVDRVAVAYLKINRTQGTVEVVE